MSALLKLPRELLHQIFNELAPVSRTTKYPEEPYGGGFDHRALSCISQTCRQLHGDVVPFLYKKITLAGQSGPSLIALLRYFEANPYAASYVQLVRISWSSLTQAFVYSREDTRFVEGLAKGLGLSLPSDWDAAEENSCGLLAGLVLLKSSGVRVVEIIGYHASFYRSIPVRSTHRLEHFTQFLSLVEPSSNPPPMSDLCRLLNLSPGIEAFEANSVTKMNEGDIDWSRMTSLGIGDDFKEGTDWLVRVIESCERLEHLEFSLDTDTPTPVIAALDKHANTMKSLSITAFDYTGNHAERRHISLAAFENLEILALNGLLCETGTILKTIPESLRILSLDGDFDHLKEDFEWFASEISKGSFPHFEEIRFTTMWTCGHATCPFIMSGDVWLEDMEQSGARQYPSDVLDEDGGGGDNLYQCREHWEIIFKLVKADIHVWVD